MYDSVKFKKLKKRYILEEDEEEVTSSIDSRGLVTNVTTVTREELTPSTDSGAVDDAKKQPLSNDDEEDVPERGEL